jgi:hypothetical protein
MECHSAACWIGQHFDTLAVAFLTIVGFIIQYLHFEGKISDRDQRDVFMRKVEEPIAQLQRDYSATGSEVTVWLRCKPASKSEEIFSRLVQINRDFNLTINRLNSSKFDCDDGWISLDTERLEGSLNSFYDDATDETAKALLSRIDELNQKISRHLGHCRKKFAPDT